MNVSALPIHKRRAMEAYITERLRGIEPPITVCQTLSRRFGILRIRTGVSSKYAAILMPVVGGFEIVTRVPAYQDRNLRYVVAHEYAHTFFYDLVSHSERPIHRREPLEEALCNLGAREFLLPHRDIRATTTSSITLSYIHATAMRYDLLPQWVAARLFVDRPADTVCFCMYSETRDSIVRIPNSDVVTDDWVIDLQMQSHLRRLVKESADGKHTSLDPVQVRSKTRTYNCSIEIGRDSRIDRLCGKPGVVSVLLKSMD